jgi:uracil-DNA glycosylase family 4
VYSIKSSFSNCSVCPLFDSPSCILETNCEDNLKKVDVIFVAENPGKDEVKLGKPLIGRAGQTFRKYFKQFGIDKMNYLLTNIVLCQTINPDGTTGNPTPEVIEMCKKNCMNIIKTCDPKLIVSMGGSPAEAFGIGRVGITEKHGDVFEWKGRKVLALVHPSFVNRNRDTWESKFAKGMARVVELLKGKKIELTTETIAKPLDKKGIFRYQIPDKFYTDAYRLVDVQYLNRKRKVMYIFRDRDNNKVYHFEDDRYVCYQAPDGVERRKLVPYDDLDQVSIAYRDKRKLEYTKTYDGDLRISVKHAMDYYHYNQEEAPVVSYNIMFFDIEVDTGKDRVFPLPALALYPINMISTIFHDQKVCYVVDNKTEPITEKKGYKLKIFKDERSMIKAFIADVKELDPDFMAGWNAINFDFWYIYTRLYKLGMNQNVMSNFGEFYVDGENYICHLPGCNAIDQDYLYRMFTFTKMENYKLGFIAQEELGETKIQLPLPFNEMYWKKLNLTIEYNNRDTDLLKKLEDKLNHIRLLNELRMVCKTSFEATSSFGQIDSLMVSFVREKGLASRNSNPHRAKEEYEGAFVFSPVPGTYDHVVDFDFASLYPSLMITYNIGINSFVMKLADYKLGYELAYHPEDLPDKIDIILDPSYTKKRVKVTKGQLLKKIEENNLIYTINGCFFKPHEKEFSIFGAIVDNLMTTRKMYKGKMFDAIDKKDDEQEDFFYTRQLVYKVLANSLYGVVANKAFRFFDLSLAAAITLSGQEALKTSIIEGDAFMHHLNTGKPYEAPPELTKIEMFSDVMPDRTNRYIVTGDTDSIFCCFEDFEGEITVDRIRGLCNEIQDFLNKIKMIDVVKRHNTSLEYNRLVLKNELVISRGLFLAKKRYAIRVINQEGKDVDKINYMGLEIKRSDYPSKSKEFLKQLSKLILKPDVVSFSEIMDFVELKKREFAQLIHEGDKSIARPVSFGKKIEDYKSIPQGVRAMQAWNAIMYDIHKTGTKAYMYKVKGIDPLTAPPEVIQKYEQFTKDGNKLDIIAIPDEEAGLPSFFVPDLQENLKFACIDRYELMLKPFITKTQSQMFMTV